MSLPYSSSRFISPRTRSVGGAPALRCRSEAPRATVPGMEAYNADHASGYTGVTLTKLQQSYDAGIKNVRIVRANNTSYCIQNTSPSTVTYFKGGPNGAISAGVC